VGDEGGEKEEEGWACRRCKGNGIWSMQEMRRKGKVGHAGGEKEGEGKACRR